jgi:LAGLIDADG DNA endonuclease family
MFYQYDVSLLKFVKIVPKNILEFLNPIVLSYLIMTDGNFDKSRNRVRIYTNSYKKEEVQILANAINTKFGIYVGVLHDRKNQ